MFSLWSWVGVVRVKFFVAGIPAVILGAALAYYWAGSFNPVNFILSLIGVILAMIGTYTFNEYYDFKSGVDVMVPREHITPFNAGSRILPSGSLKPESAFKAGLVAWILYSIIAVYFTFSVGWVIVPLSLVGLISGAFYTMPPFKWAYRGLGELLIGLNYGPLITFGAYYVQTAALPLDLLILPSLIPGLLITAVIWINEFPDYPADRVAGKMNLVARLGLERSRIPYAAQILLIYPVLFIGVLSKVIPLTGLIMLATLPIAFNNVNVFRRNYNVPKKLIPAMRGTVLLFAASTLLLSLGYILAAR
jgi:1,4-dihydroxy-2-naphthoate octaprenyltransferase